MVRVKPFSQQVCEVAGYVRMTDRAIERTALEGPLIFGIMIPTKVEFPSPEMR